MRKAALFLILAACGTEDEGPVGVNEVGEGWFEIYNSEDSAAALDGWRVESADGASWTADPGMSVGAGGMLNIDLTIPAEGTELTVLDGDGVVVQVISVPALEGTQSYGRIPDGIANWQVIDDPTPGALNSP